MDVSRNYLSKSVKIAVCISIVSIVMFICCAYLIGIRYETKKFKSLLTTLTIVFIYQIFFADVILMLLKAKFYACLVHKGTWTGQINPIFIGGPNRKKFLERRIAALKSQLKLGPTFYKRNEAMTLKYKEILGDLIVFGGFLAILLILIIGTKDPLSYYNTRTIRDVLRNPKFSPTALSNIITSDDLYEFITGTIVDGFNDGTSYNAKPFAETGWMNLQIAKVLGVIRLRQIRHKTLTEVSNYETTAHGPGWAKEPELPYKDKFWRIFQPWVYQDNIQTGGVDQTGKLYHQPGDGYVALLGRNVGNSHRVLDFLRKNVWIDRYTAIVVIEFTLYNVDADMFTLVVISAEQTAFDSFIMTDKIETLKLLFNIDNLPWYVLLEFLLYFLILMKVVGNFVHKMWYSPSVKHYMSTSWNYVDMTIVCLNFIIAIGVWIREEYVKNLLLELETKRKNEFVPFYRAATIDKTCTVLIAFLVALTTLRLWKILQFARVFRVLTSTLHHAKRPLLSTTFFIAVFLVGIGLGSYIINGSNSQSFAQFLRSITSLMSLSFGFAANVTPSEMNHGGNVIGFIVYAILVIAVTFFLLNMFITVLCLHFSKEKEDDLENFENGDHYTFWEFLQMEASDYWYGLCKKRKNDKLSKEDDVLRLRGGGSGFGKPKASNVDDNDRIGRMQLISEILETQMELIHETMEQQEENANDIDSSSCEAEKEEELNNELEAPDETSKKYRPALRKKSGKIAGVQENSISTAIRSL